MNTPSTAVSPGLGGFLAFFLLAIALWLLMRNMNARMRRMSYRAEQEQAEARRRGEAAQTGLHSEQDAPREPEADANGGGHDGGEDYDAGGDHDGAGDRDGAGDHGAGDRPA